MDSHYGLNGLFFLSTLIADECVPEWLLIRTSANIRTHPILFALQVPNGVTRVAAYIVLCVRMQLQPCGM